MRSSGLFRAVLGREAKKMRGCAQQLRRRYTAESVHDLRVATLRADFALKLFGQRTARAKAVRRQLKEGRRRLGQCRDLDIFRRREPEGITATLASRGQSARHKLEAMLKSPEYRAMLAVLEQIGDRARVPGLAALLRKRFRKIIREILRHEGKIHSSNLHALRIAIKKLHYACEFLDGVDHCRMKRVLKFIVDFQDILGDRQDAIMCRQMLAGMPANRRIRGQIRKEDAFIQDRQRKFKREWKEAFRRSSALTEIYRWAKHYG